MRKVTSQMIAAIKAGKAATLGGTTDVTFVPHGETLDVFVHLHGNQIAHIEPRLNRITVTLAGWNTRTTRDRVNALLHEFVSPNIYIAQRDWAPVLVDNTASLMVTREIGAYSSQDFGMRSGCGAIHMATPAQIAAQASVSARFIATGA